MFEGLKWSNMFLFQCQHLVEIRTILLNLILNLWKVYLYGVEILVKLECLNIFVICYKYIAFF